MVCGGAERATIPLSLSLHRTPTFSPPHPFFAFLPCLSHFFSLSLIDTACTPVRAPADYSAASMRNF